MPRMPRSLLLLVLICLSGCLPSSCNPTESRALMPSDSLSQQIAEAMTPDTLVRLWAANGPEARPLQYPRTVRFGAGGRLYVSDAHDDRNSIYTFGPDGTFIEEIAPGSLIHPYLAGLRGDTLLVFSPDAHRLDFVIDGVIARSLPTPTDLPRGPLQYLTATDSTLYFKAVGEGFEGYVAQLDERGSETARTRLPGPSWRHAGFLRTRGEDVLSLSGFRPVVDVIRAGGQLDTLALQGFYSPMLARSRAFLKGDTHEAPLLSTSAVPVDDLLFVLNLRAGWLRIDLFDRSGRLQQMLVEPNPGYNKQFYPVDLDVRLRAEGGYDIAVAVVEPVPEVRLYRMPGGGESLLR